MRSPRWSSATSLQRPVSGSVRFVFQSAPAAGLLLLAAATPVRVSAQATYTASRVGDLQVGAGASFGTSNYRTQELGGTGESLRGVNLYSTFDVRRHLGAEFNFRQTSPSYRQQVYERTYEIGGRYVLQFNRLNPYAKLLYGRGVFNFPGNIANLAFNLYSLGGGVDFRLRNSVNLRADYEHQYWFGFPLQPLAPNLVTVGIAYHFASTGRCALCAHP